MKKLFTLAAAMVAATAIGNAQVAGYKINGTANGKDGSIIYLTDVNDKSVIDSAVVTNSAFTFVSETALNEPEAFFISLGRNSAGVFVDNGAEINVDLTSSPIVSDNGGYNDNGNPVLTPISYTVTVDDFQKGVDAGVDMKF